MANTAGAGSGIAGGEQCGAECSPHCSPCVSLMLCIVGQEVNELWAGLGYYSRGKRLQEAARKVLKAFPKFSVMKNVHKVVLKRAKYTNSTPGLP